MEIEPIDIRFLFDFILNSFKGDEKLSNEYHIIAPVSQELAALDTYFRIEKLKEAQGISIEIFGIKEGEEKIGFIVLSEGAKLLYSFGINILHRSDKNKQDFINFVKSYLGGKVRVYLYKRNLPAIRFLINNNFKEVKEMDDNNEPVIYLELCQ